MPRYNVKFQCSVGVCANDEGYAYEKMFSVIATRHLDYYIEGDTIDIYEIPCDECCEGVCELEEE